MPLKQTTGSRAQVMHGTARKTTGGLTKSQLKYNKQGKIVSRKASTLAKKNNRLVKAGYSTTKGVFGSKKMKGGDDDVIVSYEDVIVSYKLPSQRSWTKGIIDINDENFTISSLEKIHNAYIEIAHGDYNMYIKNPRTSKRGYHSPHRLDLQKDNIVTLSLKFNKKTKLDSFIGKIDDQRAYLNNNRPTNIGYPPDGIELQPI
jgi:hypothetical protein